MHINGINVLDTITMIFCENTFSYKVKLASSAD